LADKSIYHHKKKGDVFASDIEERVILTLRARGYSLEEMVGLFLTIDPGTTLCNKQKFHRIARGQAIPLPEVINVLKVTGLTFEELFGQGNNEVVGHLRQSIAQKDTEIKRLNSIVDGLKALIGI